MRAKEEIGLGTKAMETYASTIICIASFAVSFQKWEARNLGRWKWTLDSWCAVL